MTSVKPQPEHIACQMGKSPEGGIFRFPVRVGGVMVKDVNPAVEKVLALQEQEARKLSLESQLRLIPQEVAKAQSRIDEEKAAIEADRQRLKQNEVHRLDVDKEMKSLEAQVVKYKTQQMEVKKNDEYQALTHEIERTEGQIGELEEKEIVLLMEQDELAESNQTTETEHQETIRLFEKEIARMGEQEAGVKAQIDSAIAAVEAAQAEVPADWLKAYQRVHQRRPKPQWVVPMEDQHCGGCHLKVSGEVEGQVLTDEKPTHCDSCGRLLYKP